jgi:hypothetical protein
MDERDARAVYARMGLDEREVMRDLLRHGLEAEARTYAEVFAYFPSARLATEEEIANLGESYVVPELPPVEPVVPSAEFPIPEGPRGSGRVSRKSAADKGRALLTEGRLRITRVDPDSGLVIAKCRGDSGAEYDLGYDPRPGQRAWRCTCQEMKGKCSHLVALQLVVVR